MQSDQFLFFSLKFFKDGRWFEFDFSGKIGVHGITLLHVISQFTGTNYITNNPIILLK